jgi:hypothetical protein
MAQQHIGQLNVSPYLIIKLFESKGIFTKTSYERSHMRLHEKLYESFF